jgi:negative regulator of sigma E activity
MILVVYYGEVLAGFSNWLTLPDANQKYTFWEFVKAFVWVCVLAVVSCVVLSVLHVVEKY